MPFAVKAILFDLDGVLADSTHAVDRSWEAWALRHGVDPQRAITVGHGRPSIEAIRIVAPQLDADAAFADMEALEESFIDSVVPVAGAPQFVRRVIELGIPWAVVTSGTRRIAVPRLQRAQIPQPPALICADDVTRGKPDPQPYDKAAAALGFLPPQCVVFEDAPAGILAAQRAGAHVIAIGSSRRAEAADEWAADFNGVTIQRSDVYDALVEAIASK